MITLIAWLIAIPILLVGIVFCIEVGLGLVAGRLDNRTVQHRIAILMPAHDEAAGIGAVLAQLMQRVPAQVRILVVADNCSDETAAVARSAGADVLVRHDPDRRGKGFALAFGRDHLRADPPDCIVVLDADCLPEFGAIEAIVTQAMRRGRPVQSAYLFAPSHEGSPMLEVSGFAFLVKNLVRQRGLMRIGAPVVLTGSGMAFPWPIFAAADLATGNIVEDLALGIDLAREGKAPVFSEARVWTEPSSTGGTLIQRTRWENGFVKTARLSAIPLIGEGLIRLKPRLCWLGLHLLVPPLALLLVLGVSLLAIEILFHAIGAGAGPAMALTALMLAIGCLVLLAWLLYGRDQMRGTTIARIPLYLFWKIPVYLKLARGGESRWVRTERKGEG